MHAKYKKWIKPFFAAVGIFILILLLCLSFLYLRSFNIDYEPKTIAQFWTENNLGNKFIANGNKIEIEVPEAIISTEVMLLLQKMDFPSYFRVDGVQVDANREIININAHFHGVKFPFSLSFEPVIEEDQIVVYFSELVIGSNGFKLSQAPSQKMIQVLFGTGEPLKVDLKNVIDVNFVRVSSIALSEGNYIFSIKIDAKLIEEDLSSIKESADEALLSLFSKSEVESERMAAQYLEHAEKLGEKDVEQLINDVLSDSEIAKDILLLAHYDVANEMLKKYQKYLKHIDKNELLETRKELLTAVLTPYSTKIMIGLKAYFMNEPLYINKGQPYQLSTKKSISVTQLVEEQKLKVPIKTLEHMAFCYDAANELMLISYQISADLYLILHEGEAITMTGESYRKAFVYEETGEADFVKDLPTWESISGELETYFQEDKVFVRYMKADEKYAFVVASPKVSYQNYWVFALEFKEGIWQILEENIASLELLNKKHPQFNLDTVTEEIEKVEMKNLPDEMFEVIYEDLLNKNMIPSKTGYTIEYCSYGNSYIDFLLSDGKEYVYLVYSRYLHTVYEKTKALDIWKDVPDIITLQEPPTS